MSSKIEQLIIDIEQEFDLGLKVYLHKNDLTLLTLLDDSHLGFVDDEYLQEWYKFKTLKQIKFIENQIIRLKMSE